MLAETIDPVHEFRHRPDADPAYNESTYYNFATPDGAVTGWMRIAFQPNRAAAQASVLLFLPGETLFDYMRVTDASDDELAVGGVRFEIEIPHVAQQLRFAGRLRSFADARRLVDPSVAFRSAPQRDVDVRLSVQARGEPFGTNGEDPARHLERTMALGHFEQFIDVDGEIVVDGRRTPVQGAGMRDHSWGPRDWAGPSWYRWITATLDDGTSIMVLQVAKRDGTMTREAVVRRDGRLESAAFDEIEVEWTDDGFGAVASCALDVGGDDLHLRAEVRDRKQFTPLKHSRPDGEGGTLETRIGYAPYRFTTSDGRSGAGIVEILDQLVEGRPVSMRARRTGALP
ncbi:hypothetical protein [Microbacterium sp.]|uniref:DUF7064 domain-containing protein n=1 Tax=Microbacterium sp. TaxID=51671 RepID=UPI0037CA4997